MDLTYIIIGLIIAFFVIVFGLWLFVRTFFNDEGLNIPDYLDDQSASKEAPPVIPRHKRGEPIEPVVTSNETYALDEDEGLVEGLSSLSIKATDTHVDLDWEQAKVEPQLSTDHPDIPQDSGKTTASDQPHLQQSIIANTHLQPESALHEETVAAVIEDTTTTEEDVFSNFAQAAQEITPIINTEPEKNLVDDSPLLFEHIKQQEELDQNSPLANPEDSVSLILVRHGGKKISGRMLLSLTENYGLRFGAMSMFNHYERVDGTGVLLFSMMNYDRDQEICPFNINTVANEVFDGLIFFVPLPHVKGLQGFDSMISVMKMIARDIDAAILDKNFDELTPEKQQELRLYVENYTDE